MCFEMRFASSGLASALIALFTAFSADAANVSITGTVVNHITGSPVARATVYLAPTNAQATSDAAGGFHFSGLEPGNYVVRAAKIGFDPYEAIEIELTETRKDVQIHLNPLASIGGRVSDEEGEPVEGATVLALASQVQVGVQRYVPISQASTDDRGEFHLNPLPAGRYLVQVARRNELTVIGGSNPPRNTHEAFVPVYFEYAADRASATPVVLAYGQTARINLSVRLQAGHRISGTIANFRPYSQPTLQLLSGDDDPGFNRSSIQWGCGCFEIHDVADGTYRLRILGVGSDNQPLVGETLVQVAGKDVEGIHIALDSGMTLRGTVRIEGPAPPDVADEIAEFLIRLEMTDQSLPGEPPVFYSETDDGSLTVSRLLPGNYRVRFGVPETLYVSSARAGDQDLLASPEFTTRSASNPKIEVVLRADGGMVNITLGAAAQDNAVCGVLIPEQLNRPAMADCSGDGSLTFPSVPPGSYRLHAWKGSPAAYSIAYQSKELAQTLAASGTPVEVRAQTTTNVRLERLEEIPK